MAVIVEPDALAEMEQLAAGVGGGGGATTVTESLHEPLPPGPLTPIATVCVPGAKPPALKLIPIPHPTAPTDAPSTNPSQLVASAVLQIAVIVEPDALAETEQLAGGSSTTVNVSVQVVVPPGPVAEKSTLCSPTL